MDACQFQNVAAHASYNMMNLFGAYVKAGITFIFSTNYQLNFLLPIISCRFARPHGFFLNSLRVLKTAGHFRKRININLILLYKCCRSIQQRSKLNSDRVYFCVCPFKFLFNFIIPYNDQIYFCNRWCYFFFRQGYYCCVSCKIIAIAGAESNHSEV